MINLRAFWLRRLHSLTGVIPIGVFLFEHMLTNSRAAEGRVAYNEAVEFLLGLPYVLYLEIFLIGIPILFHALIGVYLAVAFRPNPTQYSYFRNWTHFFQRVSGIFLLVYIVWHVYETRYQAVLDPSIKLNFFDYMAAQFTNPWVVAFQIAGTLAAIFHLANGLWTFLIVWGITVSAKAQKISLFVCYGFGLVLLYMAFDAFRGFLTAAGGM